MDKLTEQLQIKLRQVSEENRNLRADNERLAAGREQLLKELEAKIVEANEAREMEAIYSSRLTKIHRKCKKMQHDEGESYLEFIFWNVAQTGESLKSSDNYVARSREPYPDPCSYGRASSPLTDLK